MSNIQSGTQPDNLDISWMQEAEAAAQQMTDAAAEFTEMIDQKMNLTLPASLSKPEETDRDGGLVIKPKPQEFSSEDIDKAMSEITIPGDTKKPTHTEQSDIQTIIHSNQLQAHMNLRDSLHIESSQKQEASVADRANRGTILREQRHSCPALIGESAAGTVAAGIETLSRPQRSKSMSALTSVGNRVSGKFEKFRGSIASMKQAATDFLTKVLSTVKQVTSSAAQSLSRRNSIDLTDSTQKNQAARACIADSGKWILENSKEAVQALTNLGIFDPDEKYQSTVARTLSASFNTIRETYNQDVSAGKARGLNDIQAGAEAKRNIAKVYGEFSEGDSKAGVIDALKERGVNIEAFCKAHGISDEQNHVKIFDALFGSSEMKDMGEALLNLHRVGGWMGNNELGARRYSSRDGGAADKACQAFKAMRDDAISGIAAMVQEKAQALQPSRSIHNWKEQLSDSFKQIEGRPPSSKEVISAMGLKRSAIAQDPTLSEIFTSLDDFNAIGDKSQDPGRSKGLESLSKAEHAIYKWLESNQSHEKAGVMMQTLNLLQAQNEALIGQILQSEDPYPEALIRMLGPNETTQDVQTLWNDMTKGNKGFHVMDTIPAKMAQVDGKDVVVKPEEKVANFRTEVFAQLARLISTPGGRAIIRQIMEKGAQFPVTIQPRSGSLQAGQYVPHDGDATENGGSSGHVEMPPRMKDVDFKAYSVNGSDILLPGFVMIGHELGHAVHAQRGEAQTSNKDVLPIWVDLEEQSTIEGVENLLRKEHGLTERFGVTGSRF